VLAIQRRIQHEALLAFQISPIKPGKRLFRASDSDDNVVPGNDDLRSSARLRVTCRI